MQARSTKTQAAASARRDQPAQLPLRLAKLKTEAALHAAIVSEAARLLGAQRVLLVLHAEQSAPSIAASKLPAGENAEALLQAVAPWLVEAQASGTSRLRHGPDGAAPREQRGCLVAPLLAPQGALGCLYADVEGTHRRQRRFEDTERALLASLAAQAATALAQLHANAVLQAQLAQRNLEQRMTRSPGTCNTMGTASTMTSIAEALGLTLPGAASIPAMDAAHPRLAADCGERIVAMIREGLTPQRILSRESFLNAAVVQMALGGSTNAVVHMLALARRAGVALTLADLDDVARRVPVLVNLFPSGQGLMKDFHYAGGVPALMNRLRESLALEVPTASGRPLADQLQGCEVLDDDVIRPLGQPVSPHGALAVLRGNLAPEGAVIKPSAADARFFRHRGRALVFDSQPEMQAAMADADLDCDESTVLVLRNAGPVGAPGMPEWGNLPIPKKLLQRGVRDLLRISARMSGTHYGTCVLYVSPESAVGGPLALVRTGDWVELDVPGRRLHLAVDEHELARRRATWQAPQPAAARGWTRLHQQHVTQAHEGCDLDFLMGTDPTPEPPIF